MQKARQIATAINVRVRQLERQGITAGPLVINHMLGYFADLNWLWTNTSDAELIQLCCAFPGFHRYARMMEDMSIQNETMKAAGTHPYAGLPELAEPLKHNVIALMRSAAMLEREFQAAIDFGRYQADAARLAVLEKSGKAICGD